MDVPDHRSRFIALRRTRKRRGSSMVMPSLKTGHDAARRRFWLAMSGFVMALALLPFSYKVERRLETVVHIKGGESEKVDLELAQRFQSPYAHRRVLQALAGGYDPGHAAHIAAGQAGRTLIISATTVAIGFSALLTVPISELRSIGIAGLLVTVLSVMLCTLILPWVLGLLGHRINAARVRLPVRRFKTPESLCAASERWVRWGKIITRRPWTALLVAGTPLLILAFQARRISPGIPDHDSLPV